MLMIDMDGHLKQASDEDLSSLVPGKVPSNGFFETFVVEGGRPIFLWDAHWARLQRGVHCLPGTPLMQERQVLNRIKLLMRRNSLEKARVRVSLWYEGARWHQSIICQRFVSSTFKGYHVGISPMIRPKHTWSHLKSLRYTCFAQSYAWACQQGYDESILLNRQGHVVEASRANIFWVKNGVLYTPKGTTGCLSGVTRGYVLQQARMLLLPCRRDAFLKEELLKADEVFLTNAVRGIIPVLSIEKNLVSDGKIGALTRQISQRYR